MDITVVDTNGLPSRAFLSVRAGETKRMRPFRAGESFSFAKLQDPDGFVQFDVYEKIGSQMIHGLGDLDDEKARAKELLKQVNIPLDNGHAVSTNLKIAWTQELQDRKRDAAENSKHKLAIAAKNYLDLYDVWGAVHGMFTELLKSQPVDAIDFMISYLTDLKHGKRIQSPQSPQSGQRDLLKSKLATFPIGGGELSSGFPVDACPAQLPDLSHHHSLMASLLRNNPNLYDTLKDQRTSSGVTLARCLKPGMDVPGYPDVATIGIVAGDEECYSQFKDIFLPVICQWHKSFKQGTRHPTDLAIANVSTSKIDPSGKYVLSTRIRGSRNIKGFRLAPACGRDERKEIERLVSMAAEEMLESDLAGEYFPLEGLEPEEEDILSRKHFLFQKPTSETQISKGLARHWPEGRGVFASASDKIVIWCNEEEHVRLISMDLGSDLHAVFERYARAITHLENSLRAVGRDVSRDDHLGYISSCPSNLGSGLRVSVMMNLPHLSSHEGFEDVCKQLGLQLRMSPSACELTNSDRLGVSEVDVVNTVIEGCSKLCGLEEKFEHLETLTP